MFRRIPFSASRYVTGTLILVAVAVLGAALGSVSLSKIAILKEFLNQIPGIEIDSGMLPRRQNILWSIRVPRVVFAGLVGAALSVSGAAYQGVFRNPLADPYLLGVASGAGLGATIAIVFDLSYQWGPLRPVALAAFSGALCAVSVTILVGRGAGRETSHLLLAGIAVVAFFTAVQTYILHTNTEVIQEVFVWILGGLSVNGWSDSWYLGFYLLICGTIIVVHSRHLDLLRLGDSEAKTLGGNPQRVRYILVIAATLLTSAAVSVSGLISFVGLVVPHLVRLVFGWSYRTILPMSVLYGATFLIGTDTIARSISSSELPIGVVTAAVGAPFFVYILVKTKGRS